MAARLSIKTKIVLAIGIPLLATYTGMAWWEYRLGKREALADMKAQLTALVGKEAAALDGELRTPEELARTLATLIASSPDLPESTIKAWLQDNLRANPGVFGLCAAFEPDALPGQRARRAPCCRRNGRGGWRWIDMADVDANYTDSDWYRPAKGGGGLFWTEPYVARPTSERLICTCSAPLVRGGKLRGVVAVEVLTDSLLDNLAHIQIDNGYCMLVSRKGTIVAHPDAKLAMHESIAGLARQHGSEGLLHAARDMAVGRPGVGRISNSRTGRPAWMIHAPVESMGWSLAAVVPESVVLAPIRTRLARVLGVLVVGCVVALAIVLFVSAHVTRPIQRLTEAAKALAHGNMDIHVSAATGGDEVAVLARTFNTMVADLKTNIDGRIREETARKEVEGELHAARQVQEALLPGMLLLESHGQFSLDAVNLPAKLVAGDFFDYFFVDDHRLALVMADVSGKGVPAAIYMAVTRTKLRDFASPGKSPADIVAEVNRGLAENNEHDMFASLFFGYYDASSGELVYVNAGHNPPYVVRHDGRLAILGATGPLVGPFADATFREARRRLDPRDLLVLYTDGVTEAAGADGQLFGESRLESLLQSLATRPVDEVCQGITRAVRDFSPGDLQDDATILVLGRNATVECPNEDGAAAPCGAPLALPVQAATD